MQRTYPLYQIQDGHTQKATWKMRHNYEEGEDIVSILTTTNGKVKETWEQVYKESLPMNEKYIF
jgi:hypothetical protein